MLTLKKIMLGRWYNVLQADNFPEFYKFIANLNLLPRYEFFSIMGLSKVSLMTLSFTEKKFYVIFDTIKCQYWTYIVKK